MGNKSSPRGKTREANSESRKRETLPAEIYTQLRQIAERFMRGEGPEHTLQPTALVHEAFLRVAAHQSMAGLSATHVRALFAQTMRRILVDHARKKKSRKRGGERVRVELDDRLIPGDSDQDLLDLDAILSKLAELDPTQEQLVELRVFGGMTVAEAAGEMGVSKRTAEREWTAARAWLRRELATAESE
jgi:RNA polymerase sigma factor (TIGR02999 family)